MLNIFVWYLLEKEHLTVYKQQTNKMFYDCFYKLHNTYEYILIQTFLPKSSFYIPRSWYINYGVPRYQIEFSHGIKDKWRQENRQNINVNHTCTSEGHGPQQPLSSLELDLFWKCTFRKVPSRPDRSWTYSNSLNNTSITNITYLL